MHLDFTQGVARLVLLCTYWPSIIIANFVGVVNSHGVYQVGKAHEYEAQSPRILDGTSNSAKLFTPAWTLGTTRVLIVRIRPANLNPLRLPIDESYQKSKLFEALGESVDFFRANSGGQQELEFSVLDQVLESELLYRYCESHERDSDSTEDKSADAFNSLAQFAETEAKAAGLALSNYDRILVQFSSCPRLFSSGGRGNVRGRRIWIQGAVKKSPDDASSDAIPNLAQALARLICHEIGHTNGALHDEYKDLEYGNPLSVMGSGMGHFPSPYKVAFHWIDKKTQVVDIAFQAGLETSLRLYGVDKGWYEPGTHYAARIATADTGEFIFLELRTSESGHIGVMALWYFERREVWEGKLASFLRPFLPHAMDPGSLFGPTQLIAHNAVAYDRSTRQGNAMAPRSILIPVGHSLSYDMNETGLVVTVEGENEDTIGPFVDLKVSYMSQMAPKPMSHFDKYVSRQIRLQCEDHPVNAFSLEAGLDTPDLQVPVHTRLGRFEFTVLQLSTDKPSTFTLDAACPTWARGADEPPVTEEAMEARVTASSYSGVYFFKSFPAHLFSSADAWENRTQVYSGLLSPDIREEELSQEHEALSIGASAFMPFTSCGGWGVSSEKLACESVRLVGDPGFALNMAEFRIYYNRMYVHTDGRRMYRVAAGAASPSVSRMAGPIFDNFVMNGRHVPLRDVPVWTVRLPGQQYEEHEYLLYPQNNTAVAWSGGSQLPLGSAMVALSWEGWSAVFQAECFTQPVSLSMRNMYTSQESGAGYEDFVPTGYALLLADTQGRGTHEEPFVRGFSLSATCQEQFTCPEGQGFDEEESGPDSNTCRPCEFGSSSPGDRKCTPNFHRELVLFASLTTFLVIHSALVFCMAYHCTRRYCCASAGGHKVVAKPKPKECPSENPIEGTKD